MSYNSKYSGQQVENLLDQVKNGSVGGSAYPMVDHGTSDTTFVLTPNEFHIWDKVATLSLSFENESAGVVNEYVFQFTSGTNPTSLVLPDTIQWANDEPSIEANKTYQVSIVNNIGLILSV